ncbi:tRNA (uracil-5-)-methyltransferase homolog B [Chanos chanos]|uniref:tRNA (uracil(54)-C(5))-methyltransferase n=1 Tax=Chanos chanos TaxID=29144 RepID=A0A6J2V3H6_CHACN|nr:tRNA (uracil(54)-C(5))-methyltransferase homolog [Chanos chanos]
MVSMRIRSVYPLIKHISSTQPSVSFNFVANGRSLATGSFQRKKRTRGSRRTPDWETQSWEERLADTVTPLWRLSYEEQLQLKQEQQHKILLALSAQLNQFASLSSSENKLTFPLLPIVPSPVQNGYRNKSTFSINKGVDGNPKTVGFYIGTGKSGNIVCIHGDHLLNMPPKHIMVASHYEKFIRLSPLPPCIVFHDGGHWREITVRTNSAGNTMAIVYFHPQSLTAEDISMHKAALVEYFIHGPGAACQLDSLYFQESTMTRCTHQESPFQLLYGEPHIHEEALGFKFRISADSFFQVNRGAAEALYRTVEKLNRNCGAGVLLDVCCGTGAIGISLSPKVEKVIGIELVEQAVEDAKHNAAINGVQNCEFISGKAEVILPDLIPNLNTGRGLMAVVNPSRSGLHYRVIRALRNHPAIRRLIYISCKPEGEATRNFRELCCSSDKHRKLTGEPFKLTVAVPVDMFPHTPHCELVLVFER